MNRRPVEGGEDAPKVVSVEEFRGQVDSVLNGLDTGGQPVYVVEGQELKAVLISPEDWAGLMDGIQMLEQLLGDAAAEAQGQSSLPPAGPSGLIIPGASPFPPAPGPGSKRPRR